MNKITYLYFSIYRIGLLWSKKLTNKGSEYEFEVVKDGSKSYSKSK